MTTISALSSATTPVGTEVLPIVQGGATDKIAVNALLANSSGASWVGFLPAGTGAVARTLQAKVRESAVSVMDFGAVGDGVTNDAPAILLAVTAAGTNGTIVFPPGKTYLIDRGITLSAGQMVYGYGATIKRIAQVNTTTTSGITSGTTTSITVAAGTGANFKIGQTISVFQGANYGSQNVVISNIVGDVITTQTSIVLSAGSPWSGTTTVSLSFDAFAIGANCTIKGLSFDGNKANWSHYHWEITTELRSNGIGNTVENCVFNNLPGEGIQESGPGTPVDVHCQYKNNTITNVNGNGIHLSSSIGAQITGNYIYNTNLDVNVGHIGGSINFSNQIQDALISGNHLDTGRSGVGQIDSVDNSYVTFTNNTVHNMSTYMLEIRGNGANVSNVVIAGNRFYNDTAPAAANLIAVDMSDTGSGFISRVAVTGNAFLNAGIVATRLSNSVIAGNTMEVTYQAADVYHNHISCGPLFDVAITGNTIKFGNAAILLGSSATDVVISGNSCNKQNFYGITAGGGTQLNLLISNNGVTNDTNSNSGNYQGITTGDNSSVRGNNVNLAIGYCGIRINGNANAVVQANTVRSSGAGKTIRVELGSTGYVVTENQVNFAVTDAPAVGIRVANNDVIT